MHKTSLLFLIQINSSKGKSKRGTNPVAYIGIASVTHQTVINKATPAVNQANIIQVLEED